MKILPTLYKGVGKKITFFGYGSQKSAKDQFAQRGYPYKLSHIKFNKIFCITYTPYFFLYPRFQNSCKKRQKCKKSRNAKKGYKKNVFKSF